MHVPFDRVVINCSYPVLNRCEFTKIQLVSREDVCKLTQYIGKDICLPWCQLGA